MIKTEDSYELVKHQIQERYSNLFIMSKLINDSKYMFGQEYIKFNSINLFFSDEEEIEMGLCELSMFIENIDIRLQEWLYNKNISFIVRDNMEEKDIAIEFEKFNIEDIQIIFDIFDTINIFEGDGVVY